MDGAYISQGRRSGKLRQTGGAADVIMVLPRLLPHVMGRSPFFSGGGLISIISKPNDRSVAGTKPVHRRVSGFLRGKEHFGRFEERKHRPVSGESGFSRRET